MRDDDADSRDGLMRFLKASERKPQRIETDQRGPKPITVAGMFGLTEGKTYANSDLRP